MSFTFDVLNENETLAMHDRQQQSIVKLTALEQFYTDVSMVYDDENDDNEDNEDVEDNEDEVAIIVNNLDKARYQLDEMCTVIDMLTNKTKRELLYKLSEPLMYHTMNRRHFCAIASQKCDQLNHCIDIFKNGMESIDKSIRKGRTFSNQLISLSKYWRLITRALPSTHDSSNVFIDYRLRPRHNTVIPLHCHKRNGNIEIYTNNDSESELVQYLNINEQIVGFDDEEDDENNSNDNESHITDWWKISQYLYHSQINLLYFELFNTLRVEAAHWNPKYYNGITCSLQWNAVHIHSSGLNDFTIQFYCPSFMNSIKNKNAHNLCAKWNKFAINICRCGEEEENISDKLSQEIERKVIQMLFEKWNGMDYKQKECNCKTLHELKCEEQSQNNIKNIFNLNGLIGKFETKYDQTHDGNDNDSGDKYSRDHHEKQTQPSNECELLEYMVTKINHHRLSNKMKHVLKSFSQRFKRFNIKWNQLNSKSIVNVAILSNDELLLDITLNGIKITVIKYENEWNMQTKCATSISLYSVQQLEKLIDSFTAAD